MNSPRAPGSAVRNSFRFQKHLCAGSESGFCLFLSLRHLKLYHKSRKQSHTSNEGHVDGSLTLNAGKDLLLIYSGLMTVERQWCCNEFRFARCLYVFTRTKTRKD